MLAGDVPAPVRVLLLDGVAVGVEAELDDPGVPQLVEGGEDHGGDEVPAAGTEGLVVELHQHRGVVHRDQPGLGVVVEVQDEPGDPGGGDGDGDHQQWEERRTKTHHGDCVDWPGLTELTSTLNTERQQTGLEICNEDK